MPLKTENRRYTTGLLVLILSLFLILAGVMFYFAQRQQGARDRVDAAYTACLTKWGNDVSDSVNAIRSVNLALDKARDRKDHLLDALITLSNKAQQKGWTTQRNTPPEVLDRYARILSARVDAQQDFARLKIKAARTTKENRIEAPRVTCDR